MTNTTDIRHFVEPGALPRRAVFQAERRELARIGAARAFAIGVAAGAACMAIALAAWGLLTS